MNQKNERLVLLFTFLLALSFRLAFVFKVPFFSSDSAYFTLRHATHIATSLFPLIVDPLSYGGNLIVSTHVFHYILGLSDIILPAALIYKVLPAVFAASVVIMVYIFAKMITKNQLAAFFSALLASFIPIYISSTLNQISPMSLYIPLLFFLLSAFLVLKSFKKLFLVISLFVILLDPFNLLILFTFVFYLVLLLSESIQTRKSEIEAIGLFTALFIVVNFIILRTLYFEQGLAAIWRNIPVEVNGFLFQYFDLFQTIAFIGVVPLALGITGFVLSKKQDKAITLLKAVLFADFSLLLLRLIPFEQGVLVLSFVLCITSAITLNRLTDYLKRTKLANYSSYIVSFVMIVSITSLLVPSAIVAQDTISTGVTGDEIEALEWIEMNTPKDSIIVGNVNEGHLISQIAQRSNVIDTHFFYAEDRIGDVDIIFTTESIVKAKIALAKYDADYIYFTDKSKEYYDVTTLAYTQDESCFTKEFENERTNVYKVVC
jgi:hypothetical protein